MYSEEGKFLPWALRITSNHCMDHLRRKNNTSYVPDFGNSVLASIVVPSAEAKLLDEQAATELYNLLDKLPVEQKKVVCYRHFEQLSFKEISKLTNASLNTTLGRMRYALIHLRTMTQNQTMFR